jgi:hypothetical protein
MKTVLICPSERPGFRFISAAYPLAAAPFLGLSVLEYWLSHLAAAGAGEILVLAHDRPERILGVTGNGARWGLNVEVVPESRELSPAQASLKYGGELKGPAVQERVILLDAFPGLPHKPLFSSLEGWFEALTHWLPRARTPDRVGVRELSPGVWVGFQSRVSPEAVLRAPCWIGAHAVIGRGAVVGPHAIIEDGAFIEAGSVITRGYVGPDTYVGLLSEMADSIGYGNRLLNWRTGVAVEVPDPFLLCALRQPRGRRGGNWLARAAEACARNKGEFQMLWKQLLTNKEG